MLYRESNHRRIAIEQDGVGRRGRVFDRKTVWQRNGQMTRGRKMAAPKEDRPSRSALSAVVLFALSILMLGCVHSYGATGAGVTPFAQGRTAAMAGVSVRSDWRLPRTYVWYVMTEAAATTQLLTSEQPSVPAQAGHLRPVERFGVGIGQIRIPQTNHAIGFRGGPRFDLWHGSLGDTQSAWMGSLGLEFGPVISISSLSPPWQSDSTLTTAWVFMPTIMAGGIMRFDRPEQSRFGAVYTLSLNFGVQLSSSLVP
jgi:hypothetical protein